MSASGDKLISMTQAAQLVRPGDVLGLGGIMLYRRPVAFVRALLQSTPRPTQLTLWSFTASYESDLLVGAGMISHTRTCYFGLEIFGLAPMFTQAAQQGNLTIIEETEASLVMGLRASMSGVGFIPAFAWLGTDLLKLRPDIKTIQDPYSGETLVAFPAQRCNVAVIHALAADRRGNAILNGNLGVDRELAMIADTVIITAEQIVDKIEDYGPSVDIVGMVTTAVVHAPRGAYPTSCYPLYPVAGGEVMRYIDTCNDAGFSTYLEYITSTQWPAN